MTHHNNLIKSIDNLRDWIIEDMGGNLDKKDPFYPAYVQLQNLEDKIRDEGDLD